MEKMEYEVKFLKGMDSGEAPYIETRRGLSSSSTNVIRGAMEIAELYDADKMKDWNDGDLLEYLESSNGEGTDMLVGMIRNITTNKVIYQENSWEVPVDKQIDWDRKAARLQFLLN